jgi:single-strand DNA-binding protein
VLWRGLAEVAEKWLKKGSSVYIEGKIRSRKWEDKEGNTRYTTEILADNMTMLGKKEDSSAEKTETTPEQESIPQEEKGDDLPF